MEYILNKLPVKTTNNFKVNDLKIDLEIVFIIPIIYQIKIQLLIIVFLVIIIKDYI